jgi:hypothetical protein
MIFVVINVVFVARFELSQVGVFPNCITLICYGFLIDGFELS